TAAWARNAGAGAGASRTKRGRRFALGAAVARLAAFRHCGCRTLPPGLLREAGTPARGCGDPRPAPPLQRFRTMMRPGTTKIILSLTALFLLGGVCGYAFSNRQTERPAAKAHWEERWMELRQR